MELKPTRTRINVTELSLVLFHNKLEGILPRLGSMSCLVRPLFIYYLEDLTGITAMMIMMVCFDFDEEMS